LEFNAHVRARACLEESFLGVRGVRELGSGRSPRRVMVLEDFEHDLAVLIELIRSLNHERKSAATAKMHLASDRAQARTRASSTTSFTRVCFGPSYIGKIGPKSSAERTYPEHTYPEGREAAGGETDEL
jgi:hypothetical protein